MDSKLLYTIKTTFQQIVNNMICKYFARFQSVFFSSPNHAVSAANIKIYDLVGKSVPIEKYYNL